ncbi:hypothetical protein [Azospirillum argentinense]
MAIDIEEQRMAYFYDAPCAVDRERAFSRQHRAGKWQILIKDRWPAYIDWEIRGRV